MEHTSLVLNIPIAISEIVKIHYFEQTSDFSFSDNANPFWELLYVDKGEIEVIAGERRSVLKRGEIIFHKPGEHHKVDNKSKSLPTLIVIAFYCDSPSMGFFRDKVMTLNESEHILLAHIISEAKKSFTTFLNNPNASKLERSPAPPFGSEQLIKLYLEQTFIFLIRRYTLNLSDTPPLKLIKQKNDEQIFNRIVMYLEEHIQSKVTIEQICKDNLIGRSHLQRLFAVQCNCGVIEYFNSLKIKMAKQLIRDNHYNFSQISDQLGYSSIYYFSRQFKKLTGLTPSEYASSVSILSDNNFEHTS